MRGFKSAYGVLSLVLFGVLLAHAETTGARYSYSAKRGPWPANASVAEGGAGDARFVATPLVRSDLQTLEAMKQSIAAGVGKKYIAVLYTGWDWSEAGSRMLQVWRAWRAAEAGSDVYETTVYDWPEQDWQVRETAADGSTATTNLSALSRDNAYAGQLFPLGRPLGSRTQVWPALALFDGEGKLAALESGLEVLTVDELKAKLAGWVTAFEAYQALREKALGATTATMSAEAANTASTMGLKQIFTETSGETSTVSFVDAGGRTISLEQYKAAVLAQGLLCLEKQVYDVGYFRTASNNGVAACARASDFDQIKVWDSEDVSGAWRRLTRTEFYSISGTYRAKLTAALKASFAEQLDNTRLIKWSDNQYQQALLLGYNLYLATAGSASGSEKTALLSTAHAYAREAMRQNPASFWGEAARGRLLMGGANGEVLEGPVTLGFGWRERNLQAATEVTALEDAPCPPTRDVLTFSAAEVAAQDGVTLGTNAAGEQTFVWVLRHGNDFKFPKQGWYTVSMAMNAGGADLKLTGFKIYAGTGRLEDYAGEGAALLFDGSAATAAAHAPTNGDTLVAQFASPDFSAAGGVPLAPGTPVSFTFYLPHDPARIFPCWERDWSDQPKYNDLAIVISGVYTGASSGTFSVTPIATATALVAPDVSSLTIDDETLYVGDVLDALDAKVAASEAMPAGIPGEQVADRVLELLGVKAGADGTIVTNETYVTALTRAAFFYEQQSDFGFTGKAAEVLAKDANGREALEALLTDRQWLTDFLASGPSGVEALIYFGAKDFGGDAAQMRAHLLHRFVALWNADKIYAAGHPNDRRGRMAAAPGEADYDAVLRRMAVAGALNNTPMNNGGLLQTYLCYRDFANRGLLHGDFYTQTPAQMRLSYNALSYSTLDLMYTVKKGITRIDYINGTAWQTNYRATNFFGDSIHGSKFYQPWSNLILSGLSLGREIGAVCGGISKYGAMAANVSGRRSITGGQPGHCAGTHRRFDGSFWEIDSNVGKYTGNHYQLWGLSSYQALEYFDDAFDDPRTVIGYRLLWSARLRARRFGAADPGVRELYFKAMEYAPLNYQAILDTRDYLKANAPNDGALWLRWAEGVTNGLWRYPIVGWPLLFANVPEPVRTSYGEAGLLAVMKQLQVRMHDSDRKTRETYDYVSYVLTNGLLKQFSGRALLSTLGTTLDARYGTPRFTELVNWGNSYYGGDAAYQTMLDAVYRANGNPLGLTRTCMETLLAASMDSSGSTFREMCTLYASLFADVLGADYPVRSSEDPLFAEEMLSANGCLTLSSYPALNVSGSREDLLASAAPFCNGQRVIDDSAFGTYAAWTQEQYDEPWMMVQLPGDAEIYGVVVQNAEDPVTLAVEISPDGSSWTALASGRALGAQEVLKVSFDGSSVSRYVRVRRQVVGDQAVSLKLHKLQVFANRRY